jgi:outer membrane protein
MKKKAFAATLVALLTANVQANTVGLYLGGQIWQSDASGTFGEENTLIDFNLKKEQQLNYFIAVEHPFPLLPNVRISSTALDTTGQTTLTQEFSFGDETFSIDNNVENNVENNVNANFNVSYVDYTLYYQLLDNRKYSFDLGLTARDFNGAVTVTGATIIIDNEDDCPETPQSNICPSPAGTYTPTGKIKTDDIVPMLYIATNLNLPLTNLNFFAQGDFSLIDEHTFSDYQIGLSYELANTKMVDFTLTLGYKVVKMELVDLNHLYTDIEFKGAFVGMIAHF